MTRVVAIAAAAALILGLVSSVMGFAASPGPFLPRIDVTLPPPPPQAVAWQVRAALVSRTVAGSSPPQALGQLFRTTLTGDLDSWPYAPEDPTHLQELSIWVNATSGMLEIWTLALLPHVIVYFDLDSNKSTGFAYHGMPIGADFRLDITDAGATASLFNPDYLRSTGTPTSAAAFPPTGDSLFPVAVSELAPGVVALHTELPLALLYGYIPPASPRAALPLALYAAAPAFDLVATLTFDTLPTPGYDVSSPMYISFGPGRTARLPASPPPPSPLQLGVPELQLVNDASYALVLLWEDAGGNLALYDPLAEPLVVTLPRAHVRTEVTPLPPVIPAGASLIVLRSDANYVLSPHDRSPGSVAVILSSAMGEADGGRTIEHLDNDPLLAPITPYYYTAYIVTASGDYVASNYVARDRSIGSIVRGPIPGISPDSDYLVFFSAWTEDNIRTAEKYDLVICHPGGGSALITAAQVRDIRDGPDNILGNADDTIVIGYISVGEDYGERGDGSGINNPRNTSLRAGLNTGTGPLTYDYTTGEAVYTNNGYPSFYVDMVGSYSDAGGSFIDFIPDGKPDQNTEWGGLYVNPGDPLWFTFLKEASYVSVGTAGLDYILAELGMDGLFLDTLGVTAPWSFWQPPSTTSDYYWLRHGGLDLIARLAYEYPDAVLIGNRPLHFAFPEFAGSRYDDFRSYLNGVYWESWAADMNFWWSEASGRVFNDQLVAAQDNADGRGFTTLVLDYWAVMFAARESGEAQGAPWYETPLEYVAATESLDFPTHIAPSRSLAEIDDVVYNIHHPEVYGGAPDIAVVSIIPVFQRSLADAASEPIPHATLVNVTLVNRGTPPASPADPFKGTLTVVHNGVEHSQHQVAFTSGYYLPGSRVVVQVSIPLNTTGAVIGNHVFVDVVLDASAPAEHATANNHEDVLLESFFYVVPSHVYRHDPPPDFAVAGLAIDPPEPATGSRGIGQSSRAFVWSSFALAQVGNIETPFLLPGTQTSVAFTHPPIPRAGEFSLAVTLDAVLAVPEADETNNEASLAQVVVVQPPTRLALPVPALTTTASAATSVSHLPAVLDSNAVDIVVFPLQPPPIARAFADFFLFINADDDVATGYLSGFDFLVLNRKLFRHDSAAGPGWGWINVDIAPHDTSVELTLAYRDSSRRALDLVISTSLLFDDHPLVLYVYATLSPHTLAGDGIPDSSPSDVTSGGRGLPLRLGSPSASSLHSGFSAAHVAAVSSDGRAALLVDTSPTKVFLRYDSVATAGVLLNVMSDLAVVLASSGPTPGVAVFDGQIWIYAGVNGSDATTASPPGIRAALGIDHSWPMWRTGPADAVTIAQSYATGILELALDASAVADAGLSLPPTEAAPLLAKMVFEAGARNAADAAWLPGQSAPTGSSAFAAIPNCVDGLRGPGEAGPDCGGGCRAQCEYALDCFNGLHDASEEAIDCGGICGWPCVPAAPGYPDWDAAPRPPAAVARYTFERTPGVDAGGDVTSATLSLGKHAAVVRLRADGADADYLLRPTAYGGTVIVFVGLVGVDGFSTVGGPGFAATMAFINSEPFFYDGSGTEWAWTRVADSEQISRAVLAPISAGVDFIISRRDLSRAAAEQGVLADELVVHVAITTSGGEKAVPDATSFMTIEAPGHDYARLRYTSSRTSTAALLTTHGPRVAGGFSGAHESIFFAPGAPTVPSAGYEVVPGVYAVALIYDGVGYVYDGLDRSSEWKWRRLAASMYAHAQSEFHTEVSIAHLVWSGVIPAATHMEIYAELRSDRGTIGNLYDDVKDRVPDVGPLPPPSPPTSPPPTSPPDIVTPVVRLGIDGNAGDWAPLMSGSPAPPVQVAVAHDVVGDLQPALGPSAARHFASRVADPRDDLREVLAASDDSVVAVFASTHAATGTVPSSTSRFQIFFASRGSPRAGYALSDGYVALALIDRGIGYVYSGASVSSVWSWMPLQDPSLLFSFVSRGNGLEAFMTRRVWSHLLVAGDESVEPVVGLVDDATGLADYAPDLNGLGSVTAAATCFPAAAVGRY
ncbi:uncharacterized protein AMSG_11831 [Thecamonas trahens ATCC 50062]|uniref:CARDB domain-containing protein n=1 Tax=Thecamonas trahens ATCC 50062 TaxID=461836 RepID=A0A0L0D7W2_THETB|nr:hypothetical protein AMSG_11831 [Thecamonas trahens ATCC 50062]KNC48439.1 hypothetical protein AMSG_11831 [Thecamonas trahens ATCC 50062]|eukprot:XP_013758666.1 hypothetical protein AMSG_11831 [Thecamonas trahens ATCC 50062]